MRSEARPALSRARRLGLALTAAVLGLAGCSKPPFAVVWTRPVGGRGLFSVAALDLNHDGYGDLLVGIWGGAVAYFGSPKGLSPKPDWSYMDLPVGGSGYCVGSAGHLRDSPYPVIYVSAPRVMGRGAVYLFRTGPNGPEAKPWKVLWSPDRGEGFGERVVNAGDLWGDGYDDLAVGDFSFDRARGKVFVYRGGPDGPAARPVWSAQGGQRGDWFGYSLCGPGDLDGDGFADLVVGSKNCNGSCLAEMRGNPDLLLDQDLVHSAAWARAQAQPTSGRLSVFYGSRGGPARKPGLVMEGTQVHELFAYDIAPADGLNRDGHACLLVGSMGWEDNRGLVQLFEGGGRGRLHELWRLEGTLAAEGLGFRQSVVRGWDGPGSCALVLDGLGKDEDWLCQPFMKPGAAARRNHLWPGPPTGERFGPEMGSAGDVYGDGKTELYLLVPSEPARLVVLRKL